MTRRRSRFPRRWQDCERFLRTLSARGYVLINWLPDAPESSTGTLRVSQAFLSDAAYLYMYELWQDGFTAGASGEGKP